MAGSSLRRISGRRGAIVAGLALLALLLLADLLRGDGSVVRAWAAELRGRPATAGERIIDGIRP